MSFQAPPSPPPPFRPPWDETRSELLPKQVKIEISVLVTFVFFTIILILGRLRSQGATWMKILSSVAAMGADKLISYITGLTGQLSSSSDLYVLWVAFLAYLSTLATNSSCFTLVDNEEQKKSLVVQYTIAWGLIVTSLQASLAAPDIMVPVALIFWISVLKVRERQRALLASTRSSFGMAKVSKVISDFSSYKEKYEGFNKGDPPYFLALRDDTHKVRYTMEEKEYKTKKRDGLVGFAWNHFITTKDVVQYIKQEQGMEVRETCFSFAMFWLLLARIAGYDAVDVRVDFDELLKKDEEKTPIDNIAFASSPYPLIAKEDNERSSSKEKEEKEEIVLFRLVEQELEFLYDYLYTNSYSIYSKGIGKKLRDVAILALFFLLALPLIMEYRTQDHNAVYVKAGHHIIDTGITRFVILAILISEFTQIGTFLASNWAKISFTCALIRKRKPTSRISYIYTLFEIWIIRFVCLIPCPTFKFPCITSSAKVKLGQYSVLKSYRKVPGLLWFSCWIRGYIDTPRWGQAGKDTTELTLEMKEAVVSCINRWGENQKKFTKGEASLEENGVRYETIREYVGNYTKLNSQARVILIWHIATSRFEEDPSKRPQNPKSKHFEVATKFSKYCAYLVALNPQMIPGHGGDVHTVECEFDQVVRELKIDYRSAAVDDQDYIKDSDEEKLIQDPILSIGNQLKEVLFLNCRPGVVHDNDHLWKTLADFWTEMLLFLALCSDHREVVDAHANRLSLGGEFITHLWALLMHKGYQQTATTTYTTTSTA